jgi:osmotically-inducible protein OsmY
MSTDAQVKQNVIAELEWDPSINAAQIGVEVKDGVVTLAGHVDSYADKWNAERAAQRVKGVKALAVEIDVKLPGTSERNDADIARAAENVLQWTNYLPQDSVKVMVEGGWITLSGELDWDYQRRIAVKAVRHLMGVTGVSDNVLVRPKVSMSDIKSDIEAALERRARADAKAISVAVNDSVVTLSGTVHSWTERDAVTDAAWNTPGVRNVIDNTIIARF